MSNSSNKLSRRTILAGAGAAAVGTAIPFAATSKASAVGDGHGLHVLHQGFANPRLQFVHFTTPAVGYPVSVNILLPPGYANSGKRYPVLYLLHGGTGNFTEWDMAHRIRSIVGDQEVIVVMPDGGIGGWYSNPKIQNLGPRNFETFHMSQLIPWIDQNYRTIGEYAGRAIAGFSMGGFGALKYAAKYYGHFTSVTSISGPASIRREFGVVAHWINASSTPQTGSPIGMYGAPWDEKLVSADNAVENLERYRGKRVAFYSGDQADPITRQELRVREGHEEFSAALNRAGIKHHFGKFHGPHASNVHESMRADFPGIMGALRQAG